MSEAKRKTKVKDKAKKTLAESLNQVPVQPEDNLPLKAESAEVRNESDAQTSDAQNESQSKENDEYQEEIKNAYSKLFDQWDEKEFVPEDFQTNVYVNSLESCVGYSSLIRQLHHSFVRMVAFHRSDSGGALSVEG